MIFYILAGVIGGLLLLTLLTSFICFMRVFYSPKRKPLRADEYEIPAGKIYEPYREQIIQWIKEMRALPQEDLSITSFDGLTLRGKYFECNPGGIVEILFHGYQGNAERDLNAAVERCFALDHNVLIVNQRASGPSDGRVITFGINERKDCLRWIDLVRKRFGENVKILIGGVSMGAATVLMAAGEQLPENVVGVMADCGYSSAKEIIKKVIREMHLPANLLYPFVRLGGKIFGRFDLEETSPLRAMQTCKVPVLLIHGANDAFVPCAMSQAVYDACPTKKLLFYVPEAGHGLAYPQDKAGYLNALRSFAELCGF